MDDELHRLARIGAAKMGKSMSKFLAEAAREKLERLEKQEKSALSRNPQKEAFERILAGPMWDVTENGRMPTAEERNARR